MLASLVLLSLSALTAAAAASVESLDGFTTYTCSNSRLEIDVAQSCADHDANGFLLRVAGSDIFYTNAPSSYASTYTSSIPPGNKYELYCNYADNNNGAICYYAAGNNRPFTPIAALSAPNSGATCPAAAATTSGGTTISKKHFQARDTRLAPARFSCPQIGSNSLTLKPYLTEAQFLKGVVNTPANAPYICRYADTLGNSFVCYYATNGLYAAGGDTTFAGGVQPPVPNYALYCPGNTCTPPAATKRSVDMSEEVRRELKALSERQYRPRKAAKVIAAKAKAAQPVPAGDTQSLEDVWSALRLATVIARDTRLEERKIEVAKRVSE